jgi:hypothetical protein
MTKIQISHVLVRKENNSMANSAQDQNWNRSRISPTVCSSSEGSQPLDPAALDKEVEELIRKGQMPSFQEIAEALRQVRAEMEEFRKPLPKGHPSLRRPN